MIPSGVRIKTKHFMEDPDNEFFLNTHIITHLQRKLYYDRIYCNRPANDCSASNTFTSFSNTWTKAFPLYKEESQTEPYGNKHLCD